MHTIKVTNIDNRPNQFIIENGKETYFQSYDSIIAKVVDNDIYGDVIYLDKKYWNYSRTTSKYRNKFLNMTTKEIENHIKNGNIQLIYLN